MRDFSRDRRQSGGRDFKRRDDRPQTMFKTICSNCGKECEVPFKPNGSKPVFCRECFQSRRTESPRRPDFEDRGPRNLPPPPPPHREEFAALNAKLDKILGLLAAKETVTAQPVAVEPVAVVEPTPVAEVKVPVVKKKRISRK